jgi:Domain of unknown function (DUF1957)
LRALNRSIHTRENAHEHVLFHALSFTPERYRLGGLDPLDTLRIHEHLNRFNRLLAQVRTHTIADDWLVEIEHRDNLFRNIDSGTLPHSCNGLVIVCSQMRHCRDLRANTSYDDDFASYDVVVISDDLRLGEKSGFGCATIALNPKSYLSKSQIRVKWTHAF